MTEITRVPLQPIAKGSLTKLWLGVAAAVAVAGGVAWAAMPALVAVKTIKAGEGPSPTAADVVLINYVGHLPDGKEFDKGNNAVLPLDGVVPGFTQALAQMQKGGSYKVKIPSGLAYGEAGNGAIPPNTDITFDVDLIDFKSKAEIEQQQRMMQQLQQMQQMQGAPHGEGAPAPEAAPQP
ncbi:FKBP-type peptidyl-prolyl cis-trans isomerase [Novosphingobium flavum]|uniref:Peptidyl-prolyl cis-trans isomerase n=1 Tax=Novosphingobium flavum TaxID=1778672 RepID=A0A7X1KJW4_9SPHN|nr:FKBP-type peptidyl-prolyl cis-trans isomerase [Novosphingobium flavum]MBC2663911.1 FKBP-type peptidyl-prolyl cis-trans isomerase [Novosphingobium flavum]